MISKTIFIT